MSRLKISAAAWVGGLAWVVSSQARIPPPSGYNPSLGACLRRTLERVTSRDTENSELFRVGRKLLEDLPQQLDPNPNHILQTGKDLYVKAKGSMAAVSVAEILRDAQANHRRIWLKQGDRTFSIVPTALEPDPRRIEIVKYMLADGKPGEPLRFGAFVDKKIEIIRTANLDANQSALLNDFTKAHYDRVLVRFATLRGQPADAALRDDMLGFVEDIEPEQASGRLRVILRLPLGPGADGRPQFQMAPIYIDRILRDSVSIVGSRENPDPRVITALDYLKGPHVSPEKAIEYTEVGAQTSRPGQFRTGVAREVNQDSLMVRIRQTDLFGQPEKWIHLLQVRVPPETAPLGQQTVYEGTRPVGMAPRPPVPRPTVSPPLPTPRVPTQPSPFVIFRPPPTSNN
jgi:hypothetical protein